ncbi:hypothetical protein Drorol1_Dr00003936 [Drosera rotundifolia]
MEVHDVKIEMKQGSVWRTRNQRIEQLRTTASQRTTNQDQSTLTSNGNHHQQDQATANDEVHVTEFMDAEVYAAAATCKAMESLINRLKKISHEKGLSLGEIFYQVSPLGNMLLHIAASHGNEETVRWIADEYPSMILQQNNRGDTALHLAARAGHMSVVEALDRMRKDWVDPQASEEWIEELRAIPEDEKLLKIRNGKGNTALHETLIHGHGMVASLLIREDPEVCYNSNSEGKSPLYLAAEAGNGQCLEEMLNRSNGIQNRHERLMGKSLLHAAIMRRDRGLIDIILGAEPKFIYLQDEEGQTPLHCASSINYLDGVRYLVTKYASSPMARDNNGLLPIHLAAAKGHIRVIQELLRYYPDPREMLDDNGQNILHTAAKTGNHSVLKYILRSRMLECLINEEDSHGNTPLHLATMNWHPKLVTTMTWEKRVDLTVENNEGFTALDAAEYYMERSPSFKKRVTWTALKAVGAPQGLKLEVPTADGGVPNQSESSKPGSYTERVNTLLLVATLVATVTFAAGFTMPGGYNNSDPNQGMATMLNSNIFPVFVFCDTVAMYSSIMVAVSLIWAQLGDVNLVYTAIRLALPLLGMSLSMMSLAFMAGIYLVVSQLHWLAYTVFIMGITFLVALLIMFFPLCFPVSSTNLFFRYISYYPFQLLIFLSTRGVRDVASASSQQADI